MTKKILSDSKRSIEIKMASPCDMAWGDLTGDDAKRFCGQCKKHVFNISNMSSEQAIDFLVQEKGNACIMFYSRRDGTVLSADCPVGVQKRYARWQPVRKAAFGVLSLLAFGQSYAATSATMLGARVEVLFTETDQTKPIQSDLPKGKNLEHESVPVTGAAAIEKLSAEPQTKELIIPVNSGKYTVDPLNKPDTEK